VRILVLGGDGYLGWPTSLHFSARGHEVTVVDNLSRRARHNERSTDSLTPILPFRARIDAWQRESGKNIDFLVGDLQDAEFVNRVVRDAQPEAIIHYAEQPSAPYSMIDRQHAVETQVNNVVGTLNLLFAIAEFAPDAHLVKLGTMGEYGTPNIAIEEGFIEIEHKGRKDTLPFPKIPGSFYHLSKVHDSNNIYFAVRSWGVRATDLNQGVVYGISTDETDIHPDLITRFDYDELFGTVINRFIVQAIIGHPLTVYGSGGQTRGFLNIRDTLRCVELAVLNPADQGEFRVFNQFTETFTVRELAGIVQTAAASVELPVAIESVADPRVEAEEHFYEPVAEKFLSLGLDPTYLSTELVTSVLNTASTYRDRIIEHAILPSTQWRRA